MGLHSPPQPRLNTNSAIKFDLAHGGGGFKQPDSATSNTYSAKSTWSANPRTREKALEEAVRPGRLSSPPYALSGNGAQQGDGQEHPPRMHVRTIPAWVRSAEEDDLITEPASDYFLPNSPQSAFVAQHNHTPWARSPDSQHFSCKGAPWDSNRERRSRWITFAKPSIYPGEQWQGEKVEPAWLNTHLTDYSKPWLADHNEDDVEEGSGRYHAFRRKRKTLNKRMQQTILYNPMIPLMFRMTVFTFSAVAAALGASIHREAKIYKFSQGPSAVMAIIIDAVALVYILYITYDEYTGKPLGLRPAKAKLRIILLDLFFIVFQSANLSLAFSTLSDPDEACRPGVMGTLTDTTDAGICAKQKALASVLLIALIAWLNTFCVSILRLVERVAQR